MVATPGRPTARPIDFRHLVPVGSDMGPTRPLQTGWFVLNWNRRATDGLVALITSDDGLVRRQTLIWEKIHPTLELSGEKMVSAWSARGSKHSQLVRLVSISIFHRLETPGLFVITSPLNNVKISTLAEIARERSIQICHFTNQGNFQTLNISLQQTDLVPLTHHHVRLKFSKHRIWRTSPKRIRERFWKISMCQSMIRNSLNKFLFSIFALVQYWMN